MTNTVEKPTTSTELKNSIREFNDTFERLTEESYTYIRLSRNAFNCGFKKIALTISDKFLNKVENSWREVFYACQAHRRGAGSRTLREIEQRYSLLISDVMNATKNLFDSEEKKPRYNRREKMVYVIAREDKLSKADYKALKTLLYSSINPDGTDCCACTYLVQTAGADRLSVALYREESHKQGYKIIDQTRVYNIPKTELIYSALYSVANRWNFFGKANREVRNSLAFYYRLIELTI